MEQEIRGGESYLESHPYLEKLIRQYNGQAEELVRLAHKQWSSNLREYIRTETGLKMGFSEKDVSSVSMSIVDGVPLSLAKSIEPNLNILDLLLNLPLLEKTELGLKNLIANSETIRLANLHNGISVSSEQLNLVLNYTNTVVLNLKKLKLLERIAQIHEDILGSYRYKWRPHVTNDARSNQFLLFGQPETKIIEKQWIEIYWLPIALTASLLDVSIDALTVVVMAHELAHAYTHRGADIDGERWDTPAFHKTDLEIKEGLAQFYTACLCQRLLERFPFAMAAYEKLLFYQTGPYIVHKDWAQNHKSQKEVIRAATIRCRKSRIADYPEFLKLIKAEELLLAKR